MSRTMWEVLCLIAGYELVVVLFQVAFHRIVSKPTPSYERKLH